MKNIFCKIACCLLAVCLFACQRLIAQPFNLTESVQPVELNLAEYKKDGDEKARGRISVNTYKQDKDTLYYYVKGLSIYSPTYFSLNSSDANANITVNLCKENWHNIHQAGDIKGKGIWNSKFKTEGDFGIMVIAHKKPAKYVLLAWTGEEMKIEMPSVFKTANAADLSGGGWLGRNKMAVVIGVAVLLIASFLFFKFQKKKQVAPAQTIKN
jgi:hypothetical protein